MNETPRGPYDNGSYDVRHFEFMRECPLFTVRRWRIWPSIGFWQGALIAAIIMLLLMGAKTI